MFILSSTNNSAFRHRGFSLAEVLICLLIMGVLATFTIPYLVKSPISSQSDGYTANVKSTALMLSMAYERLKAATAPNSNLIGGPAWDYQLDSLTPYMNYTASDSSTYVDALPSADIDGGGTGTQCGSSYVGTIKCYRLHNGAILWTNSVYHSGPYGDGYSTVINLDPDGGSYSGSANGPGQSIQLWLSNDGKVYTAANIPGTLKMVTLFTTNAYSATADPTWYSP